MHACKHEFPSGTVLPFFSLLYQKVPRVASSHHLFPSLPSLYRTSVHLLPHHTIKAALSTIRRDLHGTKSNGPVSVLQFLTSPHCLAFWCALLPLANTPLPSVLQFVYNSLYSLPACSLMAPPHSLHTWPTCRTSVFLCGLVRSWGVEGCTTSTPPVVEKAEGRRCGESIGSAGEVGGQRSAGHGEGAAGDGLGQSESTVCKLTFEMIFFPSLLGFLFSSYTST